MSRKCLKPFTGRSRGRLNPHRERQALIVSIKEAVTAGSRLAFACQETEVCLRTYRRWVKAEGAVLEDQRPLIPRPAPWNKLSKVEVQMILGVSNVPEYASWPPSQIVPKLADKGLNHGSESSFYLVLRSHDQAHHRGGSRVVEKRAAPASYVTTGPYPVWSWNIAHCSSKVRGLYY